MLENYNCHWSMNISYCFYAKLWFVLSVVLAWLNLAKMIISSNISYICRSYIAFPFKKNRYLGIDKIEKERTNKNIVDDNMINDLSVSSNDSISTSFKGLRRKVNDLTSICHQNYIEMNTIGIFVQIDIQYNLKP